MKGFDLAVRARGTRTARLLDARRRSASRRVGARGRRRAAARLATATCLTHRHLLSPPARGTTRHMLLVRLDGEVATGRPIERCATHLVGGSVRASAWLRPAQARRRAECLAQHRPAGLRPAAVGGATRSRVPRRGRRRRRRARAAARQCRAPSGRAAGITHGREAAVVGTFGRCIAEQIRPSTRRGSLRRDPLPYDFRYGEPAHRRTCRWWRGRGCSDAACVRLVGAVPRPPAAGRCDGAGARCSPETDALARRRRAPAAILVVRGTQQAVDLAVRLRRRSGTARGP